MTTGKPSGQYIEINTEIGPKRAFMPAPLPPQLNLEKLISPLTSAYHALGAVSPIDERIPEAEVFTGAYAIREIQFSSQIEGTKTSFSELITGRAKFPHDDFSETYNYIRVLESAASELRDKKGLPLCGRLLRRAHKNMMKDSKRGRTAAPGAFRKQQNHIAAAGRAIYFPPPSPKVAGCIGDLEKFIHGRSRNLDPLLKIGLAHVQFESIHPFLDGNGRIGRLLIMLMLISEGILSRPSIAPSLYLKTHKKKYYELLQRVRTHSAWEDWLAFFLKALEAAAKQFTRDASRAHSIFGNDERRIEQLGGRSKTPLLVFRCFKQKPLLSVRDIMSINKSISFNSANNGCKLLQKMKIIRPHGSQKRNRIFGYGAYLKIITADE